MGLSSRIITGTNQYLLGNNVKLDDQVFVNLPNFGVGKKFESSKYIVYSSG